MDRGISVQNHKDFPVVAVGVLKENKLFQIYTKEGYKLADHVKFVRP